MGRTSLGSSVFCSLAAVVFCACSSGGGSGGSGSAANPSPSSPAPTNPISSSVTPYTTGQAAAVVIGQSDFVSSNNGTTNSTLSFPFGVAVSNTQLAISDYLNDRVLIFNSIPTANGAAADTVIGSAGTGSGGMNNPGATGFGSGQLFVADSHGHRVLIFPTIPTSGSATATFAVGQVNANSAQTPSLPTSTTIDTPFSVASGGGRLAIADTGFNRVLLYNAIPTANQAAADVVLGQSSKTAGSAGSGPLMNGPNSVWTDGTHVVVADTGNNRVLIWLSWPATDGQAPDLVLGQTDFNGDSAGGISSQSLNQPRGVTSDGTMIFVSDTGNNRVLVWNTWPTSNDAPANNVLGQSALTSGAANTTAATLSSPQGVAVDASHFYVVDVGNNRVLIYQRNAGT